MRPRPSPQTPRWQGRVAEIDRRPRRRRFCASWLSPSKPFLTASQLRQAHIIALTGHPVRPSTTVYGQVPVRRKKRVSVAAGSQLSVVILPPALSLPRGHVGMRVATVIPSAERWMPLSSRLSEWVLTISDRRHGYAKQVRRGDP